MTLEEVENLKPELGASLYLLRDKVKREQGRSKGHFEHEAEKMHKVWRENAILRVQNWKLQRELDSANSLIKMQTEEIWNLNENAW